MKKDLLIVDKWLEKAEEDFGFATVNLKEEKEFYDQICFHFHQAAEKYLKAYIIANKLRFEKTHNLPFLLSICAEKDKSFFRLKDSCDFLDGFYIEARYPVVWAAKTSKKDALKAYEETKRIREFVLKKLGKSSQFPKATLY